ncbi:uncharacterized protein ACBR49_007030 [Aulostomus maculatus]
MEQRRSERRGASLIGCLVAVLVWRVASAQIRYSVSEDVNKGTVVGNIAKDLGLDRNTLKERKYRIVTSKPDPLFYVNQDDGVLYVSRNIDREAVCERSSSCLINLKTVLENPLEVHYVAVEIQDINDHSPTFQEKEKILEISESFLPGTRIPLEPARDPDSGPFSVQHYKLSPSDHFRLEVKDKGDDGKIPLLIVQKALDREAAGSHSLVLTALDGGKPPRSGDMKILVNVLDINDNAPVFSKDVYSVMLDENAPLGTTVIQVNATDSDEGANGEVVYSFSSIFNRRLLKLFDINPSTGELIVKGLIDYEEKDRYEIEIQASDKSLAPMSAHKSVIIKVVDVNDNAPEIEVTSFASSVPEDSRPGTTVALISVNDLDSGLNGKVLCSVDEDVPFTLSPSLQDKMYSLVTKSALDREKQHGYELTIVARDAGQPPLSSERTISVVVADVNDNSPEFLLSPYTFYVPEGNDAGASVFSVKAFDRDENENAVISYHILRDGRDENKLASFLSINSETGDISALKSFDFETLKTFQFQVVASDSGSPSLSSNVTVKVFILDQNDNAPVILYPVSSNGSAEGVEEIPRNVNAGHLVTKVRAYDADIGYNGWLLFSLQEVSEHSLFALDRYTGQIRTLRSFTETDEAEQKLIILVKDNGNVSLSATATVLLKVVEPKEAFAASDLQSSAKVEEDSHVTFYLIITLGSVSLLFLISMVVLIAMQCSKSTDYTSKYLQDANYDGTLCHSIQYRSGDKRYMLVGPRMSIGSTIVPGSHANTLVLPDRRRCSKSTDYTSKYLQDANYDGTLCHSIQYRSGDKRYMLVGPRMSIGSTIVPGSHANTLVLPDRRRTSEEAHLLLSHHSLAQPLSMVLKNSALCPVYVCENSQTRSLQPRILAFFISLYAMEQSRRLRVWIKRWTCVAYVVVALFPCRSEASAQIRYSISEEVKVGAVVGNIAKDLGLEKTTLKARDYRIVGGSAEPLFHVNADDGILYVSRKVDREEICERGNACVINLKTVLENPLEIHYVAIEVVDVNDHSPVFPEREKRLEIFESTSPGARFQLQPARDPDAGQFSVQQYKLSHNDHFRLEITERGEDRKMPVLILQKQLDREALRQHKLLLTAVDGGRPARSGTLEIVIEVLDVNDNSPVFTKDIYSAELNENAAPGTLVLQVNATDLDEGANGDIIYSFGKDADTHLHELFSIDPMTGQIQVIGMIDYEEKDSYEIDIQASDKGAIPLTTEKFVKIKVRDVNDNPPEIEITSFSKSVPEDSRVGTTVALISVNDLDSGLNGKVSCFIREDVPFSVSPSLQDNMYAIVTKSLLDREETSFYELTVVAKDTGEPSLSSEKMISVIVSDVNDNRPQFLHSPYTFYITENNGLSAPVFSVRASDLDDGDNAHISYHIPRDNSGDNVGVFLNINSETGDIMALKSFDFETLKTFQFRVVASDSGSPSLSSNVTVKVFILDQNDNAPVILYPVSSNGSAEGVEEIPRNVNVGHLVTKVRAYDADIGYNGWLLFSLQEVSEHSLFALDRYTGQIRTLRSFTETDEAEQKLIILVKDNGNVSLSATATVLLKVVEPKEAFAASDLQSSAKVEEDSHVTFYLIITLGSVSLLFLISMVVLIAMQCSKSTDYTSKYLQDANYDGTLCHSIQYRSGDKRYMLVGPRMSIGSTIVPGSHANTLVLPDRRGASGELRYSVPEELADGAVVGNIAKDLGLDPVALNARGFRIVSGSTEPLFLLDNIGMLRVNRKIDREEVCERISSCIINVKTVVENPLEVHYVAIEVLDVNDHAPTFPGNETRLEISESALPGARFPLQSARDPDSHTFSIQSYKLSQNDHFRLEVKDRGEDGKIPVLYLHKALDKETARSHRLLLTAVDGGKPARSGTVEIIINVLDVNDNMPVFTKDSYVATLNENTPIGTIVIQVNATDLDDGSNGEVVYSFGNNVNTKLHELFEVDPNTGEIIVKGRIDFEVKDKYEMDIKASDKGTAPLATEKSVKITIVDLNDNAPEIEVTSFSSAIPEDSKPGTTVALISVNDKDSGLNGKVICYISEDVPFTLTPSVQDNMFAIVTKSQLDREHQSKYDVTIVAKDAGEPPLSSHKMMSVTVSDVNDNSPEFFMNPYTFYITENNVAGAFLFSVSANDCDEGDNALISYNVVRSDHQHETITSFLNINPETGHISALKSFDFETLKTFQFRVVASDSGSPSLSSNVTVKVFILDQNDNAPVILYPVSSNGSAEGVEEIPRNVNVGHLVTKVRAYDADIGYNGWLLFSLQEVSEHSLFALDRYTGQIRTLRSFTETDEAEQKLIILVKDNGNVSLSATATVLLKVVEPKEAFAASDLQSSAKVEEDSHVTFYLIITLGSVSLLFLISMVVLIAMQCSKSTDYTSKYLQDANYDGTLCHSIQYRSGDKRYMLVGPRMSIGSTIVPGSHANTLVLPDRRGASGEPKAPNSDWRYSASLRAGGVMQSSVHMEESSVLQGAQGVLVQNWPTASSAADGEGGEVSPPMGAGVDSNSWHFRYGPGGPGAPPQHLKPGEVPPEAFIIPGSPAIISIRQNQGGEDDKSDFITFGKKEEAKKKKKKKKEKKDKKDKGKDDGDE